jgi:SAM-dependent methyltransferase
MRKNVDDHVVRGFGQEWSHFDQSRVDIAELTRQFSAYFHIFPWEKLPGNAIGFDVGCGSGRWAKLVAPRVGALHCIDASEAAIAVARANLASLKNCMFHVATVDAIPVENGSMDFGYSLGVLHHVPDTLEAIRSCSQKLKRGAPFLVYLYFAFDNKPGWYAALWKLSDVVRILVSRCPFAVRLSLSYLFAVVFYWPLGRLAGVIEKLGLDIDSFPLASYRKQSFYTMRTDALDRFGTRLEKRFSRTQIEQMLISAGFDGVAFSPNRPYWCAVAFKA